jgi:hypothetical protein
MTTLLAMAAIQEQMEQAIESANHKQYGAAQAAFLECANLCEILALEKAAEKATPKPKQLTIDLPK